MNDYGYLSQIDDGSLLKNKKQEYVGLKINSALVKLIEQEAKRRGIKKTQLIRLVLHKAFGGMK